MTLKELSAALAARGLIAEGQELALAPDPAGSAPPWYVQVMLGVCAWFAGLFLLSFVIIGVFQATGGHDNWGTILVLGSMACLGAGFLYGTVGENSPFGNQFALAMSLAGQVGIAIGLGGLEDARTATWGMLIVEVLLTVKVPNRMHRALTSTAAVIAWAMATHEILFGELPWRVFSTGGHAVANASSLVSVMLWLVVWAPVAIAAYWLVSHEARWMAEGREAVLRPVTLGAVASLSIAPLVTHPAAFWMTLGLGSAREFTTGVTGSPALWPLLAVLLALLALALAFALHNRALMGLSILFGLLEVGSFYYVLGTSLLVKSIIMAALGTVLMGSARWLAKEARA